MESRQCPFCGSLVAADAMTCYHCREALPSAGSARTRNPAAGYQEIRRGLLYMVLAAVIHYAMLRIGEMDLPIEIPPAVPDYLTSLLFLGGLGLLLYGLILKLRG